MKRALEMVAQASEVAQASACGSVAQASACGPRARVIPVILRPCDWTSAPFGKLTALPQDGKPVVDWPTPDHGFLDVAKGLRRIAQELRAPPALPKPVATPAAPRQPRITRPSTSKLAIIAVFALSVAVAAWQWWSTEIEALNRGEAFLNVGRYADAQQPFQRALRWNPLSGSARRGLETVELAKLRPNPVVFGERLQEAVKRAPHDDHLKLLSGDYLLEQGKADDAMREYQEAVKLNPRLAEGYFRLGVLYDKSRSPGRALEMYKQAVKYGPSSPQYRNNLAYAWFKHGEYPKAIEEYGRIVDEFPLAPLEAARIYRLMGKLDEAREKETVAIEWLESDAAMSHPENQEPWYFELGHNKGVSIPSRNQKLCYAQWSLSATLYLKGDAAASDDAWKRGAQACGSQTLDVKAVVDRELILLADERDELAEKVAAFRPRLGGATR